MERKSSSTVIDFIYNTNVVLDDKRYEFIKKQTEEYLIIPLKVITLLIAISGLFAMVFEVRYFSEYQFQVYITRFLATLVAFVILVILYTKHALKNPVLLVHILLLTIIVSSGYMIFLMPSTLIVNTQIVGLMIFTSALFLSWEVKNQIIVAIYYNIVFAGAILMNDKQIYFLPNMYESVLFVIFLSVISVVGSAVNFKLRSEIAEKSFRINLSERKYRSIIQNSAEGIFQTSEDGRFLTVNQALVSILGFDSEADLKQCDIEYDIYKNPEDRRRIIEMLRTHGEIKNFKVELKKKDGSIITARINDRIVSDEESGREYFEGSLHDISDQIRLEEERYIAEEKLKEEKIKSDKLAIEALKSSEIKGQFLANMSHEIRTPINGIIGFLSLIEQGAYKDKVELQDFIVSARASAETLLDLVNDILDFSKIEAGKLSLSESNFYIRDVINEAVSVVIPRIQEKKLKLTVTIEKTTSTHLIGDPSRLRQIYLNLLSNAVKFTEEGEIKIFVYSEKVGKNKIKLYSAVEDSGIGIPQEKLNYLFKPFSQVDGSYTRKFGGTGLGLAICKELVTLMNGQIWVESNVDKGTKFTFTTILTAPEQVTLIGKLKANANQKSKEEIVITGVVKTDTRERVPVDRSVQRSKHKLLLAEDNPVNQKVILKIIGQAGYNIEAVDNGEEAVKALQQKRDYALILMDVQMPVMDGFTATQTIRALDEPLCDIPIIAITAHALSGDRDKCIEAGMNDYVTKPIKTVEMLKLLDGWLRLDEQFDSPEPEVKTEVPDEVPLFDKEHFGMISSDNKEFQVDLLGTYLSDLIRRLGNLENSINAEDIKKVQAESHTIKGASFSIGANALGNKAFEIETAAKENNISVIKDLIVEIKDIHLKTKVILEKYLE
ncbi:MAG TPA: ATP-binding protein [Ignavibacteriaceae bacterium]|nr:ATP-binding protein [Ignavibacteriaceae bacterium]